MTQPPNFRPVPGDEVRDVGATVKRVAITIAAVVLLVGCGSDQEAARTVSETTTPAASMASPTPTPTPSTATKEQYASIVAETASQLRESIEAVSDCTTTSDPLEVLCGAQVYALSLQATTLALGLEGAQKEGVPAYIGPPPAELADLVAKTEADANALAEKASALHECEEASCFSPSLEYGLASLRMLSRLDAWAPYGVR